MEREEGVLDAKFEQEFKEAVEKIGRVRKSLCCATIDSINSDHVIVNVGLKSEVCIPVREFGEELAQLSPGDSIEVYIERVESSSGETVASYARARCERTLDELCASVDTEECFEGTVYSRVRGGYVVNLCGIAAFLPFSQIDSHMPSPGGFLGSTQQFKVVSVERDKGSIVVSYRPSASATSDSVEEGSVVEGIVKNLTDYGAFVDIGGKDGLLHVTDIAWGHVHSPGDVLKVGQKVTVKVIKMNRETGRISLGMKQLEQDPWLEAEKRILIGDIRTVETIHVQEYGVFVLLDKNIEGFVHVKEMSWYLGRQIKATDFVKVGEKFDARVLDVDRQKRRFTLSKRQVEENPWQAFVEKYPAGSVVSIEVVEKQRSGLTVKSVDNSTGFVPADEIAWGLQDQEALDSIEVGSTHQARVVSVDLYGEGVTFSVKGSVASPVQDYCKKLRKGDVVTCSVVHVLETGVIVEVKEGVRGFIRRTDLAKERGLQADRRYAQGDRVDASFVGYNKKSDTLLLSVRQREIEEEQQVMEQYGSVSSGASLKEILGGNFSEDDLNKKVK